VGGWGVTVGDWGVTVEVAVTVGEIGVTDGTKVVTVKGCFITVVGAWWGVSAEQGGQPQSPTSPRENMDLRVGLGSLEQVEWTHLLQQLLGLRFAQLLGSKRSRDIWDLLGEQGRGRG